MPNLRRAVVFLIFSLGSLLLLARPTFAGAFHLTSIGQLATQGAVFDKWYYTGTQPTFRGEGLAGETVTIVLDGESFTSTIDENNQWSFTPPTSLTTGEHYISFASAGSSFGFTLIIGNELPADLVVPEATSTPVAGGALPTLLVTSLGSSLLGISYLVGKR